ncbi:MAG TPA: PIN domain-containing protein [Solirubrobacteraceae bacterium]|nr:PIN domain-containing protein [Solirubrobacteraceae bacterium]
MSGGAGAGLPRAVLDSNVIFSRVLHELLGRCASEARLLDLIWSDELLAEAKRVLQERKPMPEAAAERWVSLLREAFPDGRVDAGRLRDDIDLATLTGDPEDQFVCALAIAGRATHLFSFDAGYRADALAEHGVAVMNPDTWLTRAIDDEPELFVDLLTAQAAAWGGRSVGELLDALERAGAVAFAEKARPLWRLG